MHVLKVGLLLYIYFDDDGLGFSIRPYGSFNSSSDQYEVTINSSYEDIRMYFPYKPINGIYTTTTEPSDIGANEVYISVTKFYFYVVESGSKVYVNVDDQGVTSISICGAKYSEYNWTLAGNASFQ